MSWYDNVFLGIPEPTDEETYINNKIASLEQDFEYLFKQAWFNNCVDWDKIHEHLYDVVKNQLEDDKSEAHISAYEAKKVGKYNE